MKNLTAARDAVGSEEPIATGGWSFMWLELNRLIELNEVNKVRLGDLMDLFSEPTFLEYTWPKDYNFENC